MRKCIRCGCEMKENCAVKIEGAGYGIVLSSDENKLFGGRIFYFADIVFIQQVSSLIDAHKSL